MTQLRHYFLVTVDGRDLLAEATQEHDGKWYAVINGFGCSKSYATPQVAIRSMLADHACTASSIQLYPDQVSAAAQWYERS